ncbi:MAG TPA: hypothetical protein VKI64_06705 [Acidimicrobiales bacterium]|nr:hypothetical protein [Acidimicrobiales bacterium]
MTVRRATGFREGVSHERPRLAIAVEPAVFGHTLASALEELDVDEVVHLDHLSRGRAGIFDAAVVTIGVPVGLRASVVIGLPQDGGNRPAFVEARGRRAEVSIDRLTSLFDVLDTYCPGARRRGPQRRGSSPE